jgi:molecular chaperone GrpE
LKVPEDDSRRDEVDKANGQDATESDAGEPTGLAPAEPAASEIERLKRESDELRDQLLRRRADFENYRKRVERDRQQAAADAEAALIKRMIPTLDNLERALGAGGTETSLREGVELTLRELTASLEAAGVRVENPAGERFDPRTQQALAHEVVPGYDDGVVVEVFRKGYFFGDRLLRPALVKVAKAQGGPDAGGSSEQNREPEALH